MRRSERPYSALRSVSTSRQKSRAAAVLPGRIGTTRQTRSIEMPPFFLSSPVEQTANASDLSTAAARPLLPRRTVPHRLLRGLVDLFGGEEHRGFGADRAARVDGQRGGGEARIVGGVQDDERVVLAEGEIERLHLSVHTLDRLLRRRPARGAPALEDPFRTLRRVRSLDQVLGHITPPMRLIWGLSGAARRGAVAVGC